MKKIFFLIALLFGITITGAAYQPGTAANGSISNGIYNYTGTLSVTTVAGITTSYTGKNVQVTVIQDEAEFTLLRVPTGISTVTVTIPHVRFDTTTGVILPWSGTGIEVLYVALTGNIYGNSLSETSCDLEFDVEDTGGFTCFRFTGHSTN